MDDTRLIKSKEILEDLRTEIISQECCRLDIRTDKSFFIGFGEKHIPKSWISKSGRIWKSSVEFYGSWELCVYSSSWRIHKNKRIIIASDTIQEKFEPSIVNSVKLVGAKLLEIKMLSEFDVRFKFSNGMNVDILCCFTSGYDRILTVLKKIDRVWWALEDCGEWQIGEDPAPVGRTYIE